MFQAQLGHTEGLSQIDGRPPVEMANITAATNYSRGATHVLQPGCIVNFMFACLQTSADRCVAPPCFGHGVKGRRSRTLKTKLQPPPTNLQRPATLLDSTAGLRGVQRT